MQKRRQVALLLSEQEILDAFNGPMVDCFYLPPDTKVVHVYHDWYRQAFALCLESEYFKEVEPNLELHRIWPSTLILDRDSYLEKVW